MVKRDLQMRDALMRRVHVAQQQEKADLVFKNAQIMNVYTGEMIGGDVAICDGYIAGIGSYTGKVEIDVTGKWLAPGLIDAHVHMESSMVTPKQFALGVLPNGTTTVIADPHEIANVKGTLGIEYMIEESRNSLLDVYFMLPSCVPATPFEHAGATIGVEVLKTMTAPEVLGLGELMNFVGATHGDEEVIDKVIAAPNGLIDGHGPGLSGDALQAYIGLGVRTDHECTNGEEMIEKMRLGQYILMREGSAARNVKALVPSITANNKSRALFCTDDKHPGDLLKEGHIDYAVRLAIREGLSPLDAVAMASINVATCYGLNDRGAIAPGMLADIIVLSDLDHFMIESVYKRGVCVTDVKTQKMDEPSASLATKMRHSVQIKALTLDDFKIPMHTDIARVIKLRDFDLVTDLVYRKVDVSDGHFAYHKKLDLLKLAVVERHHATGQMGLGLIEGYGLHGGAIGTSVAHDSHNLILIGDSDADLKLCAERLQAIGGGIVISHHGEIIGEMALPIAGLMSEEPLEIVQEKLEKLHRQAHEVLGVSGKVDPFMTLAFMALPVIPSIKLTDMGLFDVEQFKFVEIAVTEE